MNCICIRRTMWLYKCHETILTVDERAVEPLNVIILGEGEENLITDDWEREQEDGPARHRQGEGAQVQSEKIIKKKRQHKGVNILAGCYFLKKTLWCINYQPIYFRHFISPGLRPWQQTKAVCLGHRSSVPQIGPWGPTICPGVLSRAALKSPHRSLMEMR